MSAQTYKHTIRILTHLKAGHSINRVVLFSLGQIVEVGEGYRFFPMHSVQVRGLSNASVSDFSFSECNSSCKCSESKKFRHLNLISFVNLFGDRFGSCSLASSQICVPPDLSVFASAALEFRLYTAGFCRTQVNREISCS